MVEHTSGESHELDRVFRALSDPTRRALLQKLSEGPQTVTDLAAPFEMSLAAVSKHLRVLEKARLIRRRIRGRQHQVWLRPQQLGDALDWLRFYERFWGVRLDRLQRELEGDGNGK